MTRYGTRHNPHRPQASRRPLGGIVLSAILIAASPFRLHAQTSDATQIAQKIQQLNDAMEKTQAQIDASQHELIEMRQQLKALQQQMAATAPASTMQPASPAQNPPSTQAQIDELREHQDIQSAQIATHEQAKVETESKYPVKLTGLMLLTGFVNTRAVDVAATPTLATPGAGSTGLTLRQTVLGFDARGPRLFGAKSYADLRVDFNGNPQSSSSASSYTGYSGTGSSLLRLRSAHAGLRWEHTEAFFSLDKPIISPDTPTSLTAVAEPALAWSGNLWAWNPQLGITQRFDLGASHAIQLQGALIDPGDAPIIPTASAAATSGTTASTAEQSRWPGIEGHVSLIESPPRDDANHLGIGGYLSPHLTPTGQRFNSWAGTLDARYRLPLHLSWTANVYRGAALGGLGAGGFKDYVYATGRDPGEYYFRRLNDAGGWTQLKEVLNNRLELNAAFGFDNVFARHLRPYYVPNGTIYQNLARNRTYTGNIIYSPSAYLLFSLEYRHVESAPVIGPTATSNIIGIGAGYKF